MLSAKVYPIQDDTDWKHNPKTRNRVPQDGSGRTPLGRVYRTMVATLGLDRFFIDDHPAKPVYVPIEPGLLLKCQQINLYNNPAEELERWRDYDKHGIGDEDDFDEDFDPDEMYEKSQRKRYETCSGVDHYRVVKFRATGERFFIGRLYRKGYGSKVRFIAGATSPEFWDRVIQPYSDENAWILLSRTRPRSISERAIAAAVTERERKAAFALAEAEAQRAREIAAAWAAHGKLPPQETISGLPLFGGEPEQDGIDPAKTSA